MKNTSKTYRTIGLKSMLAWGKIFIPGFLFSIVGIVVAIRSLIRNPDGLNFFRSLGATPWSTILLFASLICIGLYFLLANTFAIKNLTYLLWNNKLADFIIPRVHSYIFTLNQKQPGWMKNITGSDLSQTLLDFARTDGTLNRIQKLVMTYGFKKMKFRNQELAETEELNIASVVVEKLEKKINNFTSPSPNLFVSLIIIHIILFILAVLFS